MFDESTLRERSIFRIKITYRIISFLFFLILLEEELKYLASFKRVSSISLVKSVTVSG